MLPRHDKYPNLIETMIESIHQSEKNESGFANSNRHARIKGLIKKVVLVL